ncbi:unnamed protein product, partial [Prorocentrum cordatum]
FGSASLRKAPRLKVQSFGCLGTCTRMIGALLPGGASRPLPSARWDTLRTGAGSACRGDVAEKIGRPEGAKLPSRPRAEVPVEKVGSVARAELCARYRETNSTRRGEAAAEISCRAVLSAGPPAGVAAKVNEDGRQVPLEKRPLTWKVGD